MGTVTNIHAKIPTDNLAARLKLLRIEMRWSQREAAKATGVNYGTWQGMETGVGTRNVDRHIAAIAAVTGYDRDWLMWGGPLATEEAPHPREGEGPAAVRREGLEPPTRCVIEALELVEVANVILFPLWRTGKKPDPVVPRRVPLTLVPATVMSEKAA